MFIHKSRAGRVRQTYIIHQRTAFSAKRKEMAAPIVVLDMYNPLQTEKFPSML